MTQSTDPWSSGNDPEDRRAAAVLARALDDGLVTAVRVRQAVEATGLDPDTATPSATLEVLVAVGVLHPTAVARLERQVAERRTTTPTDPFEQFPVDDWDRYELVEFIGRGGMGDVYRAKDPRLGRSVAIKFLRRDDPKLLERFVREARLQARVDHDGVCPVYEVGEVQGHPFIVMQYVSGGSLREVGNGATLREKVQIIADAAEALHAAHRLGLIHRDVKPGNILVEPRPEGGWRPFMVDFGIARELDAADLTVTGAMIGTPAFSAPEQLKGRPGDLDPRCDVYGLGATLYWFLTERTPFEGSYPEILAGLSDREPEKPSTHDPTVPRDLETIVLKALSIDRERRYASAYDMAEDLRRFLAGEPIAARPDSPAYRLRRWVQRHPSMTVGVGVAVAVAAISIVGYQVERLRSRERARLAVELALEVSSLEDIVRAGSMLPAHDGSRERDRARMLLADLEDRIGTLGPGARGPGSWALGRGHFALRQYDEALDHLRAAQDAGFQNRSLSVLLGLAEARALDRALADARQIDNPSLRQEATAGGDTGDLRGLALVHLRQAAEHAESESSGGRTFETAHPLLIRGLLAALEGRADEGLALAGQARDEVPWDIRPVLLSGRIHLGLAYGREDAGDVDGALAELERAGAFFESAVTIGRSDPDAHTDLCRRWSDEVRIRDRAGRPSDVVFQRATAHCDQAVAVAPDLADPHIALARLLWQRADGLPGAAPEASEHLDAAIAAAGRAVGLEPKWGEAHHALGTATRIRSRRVEDPETTLRALDDATASLARAVALEPGNAVFLDDLAYAHDRRARIQMRLGTDPTPALDEAIALYSRAIEAAPRYPNSRNNLGIAHWRRAVWRRALGDDPTQDFQRAAATLETAVELNPAYAIAWANLGMVNRTRALVALESGDNPDRLLTEARSALDGALEMNPSLSFATLERLAVANLDLRRRAPNASPELIRSTQRRARATVEAFPASASILQTAAETMLWSARSSQGATLREHLDQGLIMAERAVRLDESSWRARLTRARLEAERAGTATDAAATSARQRALADLDAAVALNPMAQREAAALRAEIESPGAG
jgi:tetratricopeptide (TPR) repeat protein/predicted Ser/Thr protein kinase